jgi:hypothetical protein
MLYELDSLEYSGLETSVRKANGKQASVRRCRSPINRGDLWRCVVVVVYRCCVALVLRTTRELIVAPQLIREIVPRADDAFGARPCVRAKE